MILSDTERAAVERLRWVQTSNQPTRNTVTVEIGDLWTLLSIIDDAYPPERETHPGKPHSRSATRQR
jgi:hypothetical protein